MVVCHRACVAKIRERLNPEVAPILVIPDRFDLAMETIRDARFDVLYYREIGTDATNYFLPFVRLAPVQCTSFGIQVTSGIPNVDYYLSSELVEPDDAAEHYSERLLLAQTLLPYRQRASLPVRPKSREEFGFSARQHVYLCAQQLGKIHPDFDAVLAEILRRDPAGVVVLTRDRYGGGTVKLCERFTATISDVAGRITSR